MLVHDFMMLASVKAKLTLEGSWDRNASNACLLLGGIPVSKLSRFILRKLFKKSKNFVQNTNTPANGAKKKGDREVFCSVFKEKIVQW